MKTPDKKAWAFAGVLGLILGLVLGAIACSFSWGAFIHDQAFHCTDDLDWAFLGFVESIDVHERSGDVLGAGWTWERIANIRMIHLGAFWLLALAPMLMIFRAMRKSQRRQKKLPNKATLTNPLPLWDQ